MREWVAIRLQRDTVFAVKRRDRRPGSCGIGEPLGVRGAGLPQAAHHLPQELVGHRTQRALGRLAAGTQRVVPGLDGRVIVDRGELVMLDLATEVAAHNRNAVRLAALAI